LADQLRNKQLIIGEEDPTAAEDHARRMGDALPELGARPLAKPTCARVATGRALSQIKARNA
jgi:hypothetical protein